ncbi:MAG: response regulator [Lachnospiraceae bacterium]|nr:response regulator [Lachnospiraceae bacterium]
MKKILIIDDSPFIAMEIKEVVTEAGFEVVGHSRNGEDGIKKYREFMPDIVTLDIIMPGIDGIETAYEIRKINPDAKLVMLSSLCDDETKKELEEARLEHVVEKPIDKEKLISILESL